MKSRGSSEPDTAAPSKGSWTSFPPRSESWEAGYPTTTPIWPLCDPTSTTGLFLRSPKIQGYNPECFDPMQSPQAFEALMLGLPLRGAGELVSPPSWGLNWLRTYLRPYFLLPGKPVTCDDGLLSTNYGLLWGTSTCCFVLLGFQVLQRLLQGSVLHLPFINPKDENTFEGPPRPPPL